MTQVCVRYSKQHVQKENVRECKREKIMKHPLHLLIRQDPPGPGGFRLTDTPRSALLQVGSRHPDGSGFAPLPCHCKPRLFKQCYIRSSRSVFSDLFGWLIFFELENFFLLTETFIFSLFSISCKTA